MNWQIKDFVFAGIAGALSFATAFLLGSGLILATGIPATGGIVNILVVVLLMTVAKHIKPIFGFATLAMVVTFTIAIPTIIAGPPGLYKIIIGFLLGLSFDTTINVLGNKNRAYLIGGAICASLSLVSIFFAMQLLELPGVEKLQPLLKYLIPVQALNGLLGAYLGNKIFNNRLKDLPAVKRMMI